MTALEIATLSRDYTEHELLTSYCPTYFIKTAQKLCQEHKRDCAKCWDQKFDKEDSK